MFDRILVLLDGSSLAECALPHVVAIARAFDAQVTLLRVLEQPHGFAITQAIDPLEWQLIKIEAEVYLNDAASRLQDFGLKVKKMLKERQAAECIIEFAHQNDIDLIVRNSRGKSGWRQPKCEAGDAG